VLKELVPGLKRVAVLSHPTTPSNPKQLEGAEVAARALGIDVKPVPVRDPDDFEAAFEVARGADGLLLLDIALFTTHRDRLVTLAATNRLPAIYGYREMVEAGGLMSYGVSFSDMHRRAATYVDKILKGAKPADLPVEEPTKFRARAKCPGRRSAWAHDPSFARNDCGSTYRMTLQCNGVLSLPRAVV
jgi:putative ABC transport system substrate-binding protein